MGIPLARADVAALERRTEGWIVGLQLAAVAMQAQLAPQSPLSMQGRSDLTGFIQAFNGSSRFILDYLIEEVFERQTPEVKDFLLKTSILERLSGPLRNGWLGIPTAGIARALEQALTCSSSRSDQARLVPLSPPIC
jgi:LuxR family maltose regulon positive regulatory protein